jgi:acetyltransferase-like isoleucine patch superfamily enzyme
MRELIFLTLGNHLPRIGIFDKIRYIIFRLAGLKINGKCIIYGRLTIRPIGCARNIEIGKGSFINTEVRFGVRDQVTIGKNVLIGPRVMFETTNHNIKIGQGRGLYTKPIVVEDRVWIGAGSIIVQGVTIGRGSVVAAGAVVTKNVEANTLVGGVPAKFIRNLDD